MAKARHNTSEVFMARSYHEMVGKLKREVIGKGGEESAVKKRGPGLGSRAPKIALR
jgi:hypothetical protein